MSPTTLLVLIVLAVAASIFIGSRFKMNIGLPAIFFCFMICMFGLGWKSSATAALWPTSTMFTIICITIFFGYANENGTETLLARHLIYAFRKFPKFLPFVFFIICAVLSAAGCSPYAIAAVVFPLIYSIAKEYRVDPLLFIMMQVFGTISVSYVPWSMGYQVEYNAIVNGVSYADKAGTVMSRVFMASLIYCIVGAILIYIIMRGYKLSVGFKYEKPEAFNRKQKITLALIVLLIVVMVIPASLATITKNATLSTLSRKIDVTWVCILLAIVSSVLKLGDSRTVIAKQVPWGSIVMLCGVGMLVNAAAEGGAVSVVGNWIGSNIPVYLMTPVFVLLGGFLSFFVSSVTVAAPTLYAIVPSICAASATNPVALYVTISLAVCATSNAPFSGGGAMALSLCPDEETRNGMFKKLCIQAGYMWALLLLLSLVGFFNLFGG